MHRFLASLHKLDVPADQGDDATDGLHTLWYDLVRAYSLRELTFEDDKLPALSGLASLFAARTEDCYCAGLWERDLAHELLWSGAAARPQGIPPPPGFQQSEIRGLKRPGKHRAPSWSWASFDGQIIMVRDTKEFVRGIALADAQVFIQTSGTDLFGRVDAGSITLMAILKRLDIVEPVDHLTEPVWNGASVRIFNKEKIPIGNASFDEPDKARDKEQNVYCVPRLWMEGGFVHFVHGWSPKRD